MIWTESGLIFKAWRKARNTRLAKTFALLVCILAVPSHGWAELTVEITKGNDQAVPVAVVPCWTGSKLLPGCLLHHL